MRPDQLQMLDDLAERLADSFILEADPINWPGAGKLPIDMDREERGDRHWCKKGAMGTGGVLKQVLDIKERALGGRTDDEIEQGRRDDGLDAEISRAQKQAEQAMARVMGKGKAEFDKRVHGS